MANKDKIIAAFLVSLGLFSTTQATQYISALSVKDKAILYSTAQDGAGNAESTPPTRLTVEQNN